MINCRARSYGLMLLGRGQPGSPGSGGASPYLRRGILRQPARHLNAYGVNPGMCLARYWYLLDRRRPYSRSSFSSSTSVDAGIAPITNDVEDRERERRRGRLALHSAKHIPLKEDKLSDRLLSGSPCLQVNDVNQDRRNRDPKELVPIEEREPEKGRLTRVVKRYP